MSTADIEGNGRGCKVANAEEGEDRDANGDANMCGT
jgi:hypothetical protein